MKSRQGRQAGVAMRVLEGMELLGTGLGGGRQSQQEQG